MIDKETLNTGVVVISAGRYEDLVRQKYEMIHSMRKVWALQDEMDELKQKMAVYEEFFQDSWYKHCFEKFLNEKNEGEETENNGNTECEHLCTDCQSR